MKTIVGKEAVDIEVGERIICRDGAAREVICSFRAAQNIYFAFNDHPFEGYENSECIDLA